MPVSSNTEKAEAGERGVQGQPGLHSQTLSPAQRTWFHPKACLPYSHATLVGAGKNHPRIFTTAMDSSQHPWHHQGRLIKATRTQLSDYSSHDSRGTKEGILPVSSAESHSCQATVAGKDPTGRSPEKRFGNKLATQPPYLTVSLSPPPGPFVFLQSICSLSETLTSIFTCFPPSKGSWFHEDT